MQFCEGCWAEVGDDWEFCDLLQVYSNAGSTRSYSLGLGRLRTLSQPAVSQVRRSLRPETPRSRPAPAERDQAAKGLMHKTLQFPAGSSRRSLRRTSS